MEENKNPLLPPLARFNGLVALFAVVVALGSIGLAKYLDFYFGEVLGEIAAVRQGINDLGAQGVTTRARASGVTYPPMEEISAPEGQEWMTYTSSSFGFQISVPSDVRVEEGSEGLSLYSVTENEAPPVMVIRVASSPNQLKNYPDGARTVTKDGKYYVMYLWENLAWPPFDQVVASFK